MLLLNTYSFSWPLYLEWRILYVPLLTLILLDLVHCSSLLRICQSPVLSSNEFTALPCFVTSRNFVHMPYSHELFLMEYPKGKTILEFIFFFQIFKRGYNAYMICRCICCDSTGMPCVVQYGVLELIGLVGKIGLW